MAISPLDTFPFQPLSPSLIGRSRRPSAFVFLFFCLFPSFIRHYHKSCFYSLVFLVYIEKTLFSFSFFAIVQITYADK